MHVPVVIAYRVLDHFGSITCVFTSLKGTKVFKKANSNPLFS